MKGEIDGEKIVDLASRSDIVLAISDKGQVFGWGNSEYSQFSMVTKETQVHVPRHLPFKVGTVKGVAAGGSMCAILNSKKSHKFIQTILEINVQLCPNFLGFSIAITLCRAFNLQ